MDNLPDAPPRTEVPRANGGVSPVSGVSPRREKTRRTPVRIAAQAAPCVFPRVTEPASDTAVMLDQFDWVMDHARGKSKCTVAECPDCQIYAALRRILLARFT